MADADDTPAPFVDSDFSHANSDGGFVHLTVATQHEEPGFRRHEFQMHPVDAIELGQKLITAGVRTIRNAVTKSG